VATNLKFVKPDWDFIPNKFYYSHDIPGKSLNVTIITDDQQHLSLK